MTIFDYIQQDRSLFGIEWHKEQVIKDEQLTPFDFFEFRFEVVLDLCDLELSEQFGGVGIQSAYSPFACLMSECACQEALARA